MHSGKPEEDLLHSVIEAAFSACRQRAHVHINTYMSRVFRSVQVMSQFAILSYKDIHTCETIVNEDPNQVETKQKLKRSMLTEIG